MAHIPVVRRWLAPLACASSAFVASCDPFSAGVREPYVPVAARLIATSDLIATGEPGANVPSAPTVLVTDSAGRIPFAGIRVTFAVTGGAGTLGATAVLTDARGIASAGSWRLGDSPGPNTVVVSAPGLAPLVFTATGAAPRARFDLQTIGGRHLPLSNGTVTITGGRVVLYDDGTCTHGYDGFGNIAQCYYTLTGKLDDRASLAFFDKQFGTQFAAGESTAGVMTVTYTDWLDFETEVYRLAGG